MKSDEICNLESNRHKRVDYTNERLSSDEGYLKQVAREVAQVAIGVEKGYGAAMDMEGVVLERGGTREIHLVQARPIVG